MGQTQTIDSEEKKKRLINQNKNHVLNNMIKRVQQNMEEKNSDSPSNSSKKSVYQLRQSQKYTIQNKENKNIDININNSNMNSTQKSQNNFNQTGKSEMFQVPSMESAFNSDINIGQQMQNLNQNGVGNNNNLEDNYMRQPNPKMSGEQKQQKTRSTSLKNVNNNNTVQSYTGSNIIVNCDIQEKIYQLPPSALQLIVKFLINDIKTLSLISASFYYKIHEVIEEELEDLDNKFISEYYDLFCFRNSYFSYQPIQIHKNAGYRMDRNIIAEVLPVLKNKCVTISYTYRQHPDSNRQSVINLDKGKEKKYFAQFKFDILDKSERRIWVYKEECRHNFDENKMAFVQPIIPVLQNDCIKFSVNFYNLNGLVDLSSIKWYPPIIEEIQQVPLKINYNEIQLYDKNRICEVEEIYTDWILYEYYHRQEKLKLDHFQPQLVLEEVRCAGVDIITSKHVFRASQEGNVEHAFASFGVHVTVVGKGKETVSQIKKIGLFYDQENTIQLRIGDILVVYISKGD